MTYDRRHVLAQWGGTLAGGEIWSNSVRLCSSDTGDDADVPDEEAMISWLNSSAADAVATFHANTNAKVHVGCKLTYLKMNVVDQAGHYVQQNTLEHVYSPVVSGGSSATPHPTQITLAVSLTTAFERGPAHRGRFYLPMPAIPIDNVDGTIDAPTALGVATAAAAFIVALADEPGPDPLGPGMRVCVMSKIGPGATNLVTGVDVGRVLDTQRRRRNALPEGYQHAVVDQGAA